MNIQSVIIILYLASILILCTSVIIAFQSLPILLRLVKKQDGLRILRDWLLKKNKTIIFICSTAASILILAVVFLITGWVRSNTVRLIIACLILAFSLGFLRFALLNRKVLRGDYKL